MEKIKNRNKFLKNISQFCSDIQINPIFEEKFREHNLFREHAQYIEVSTLSTFSLINSRNSSFKSLCF